MIITRSPLRISLGGGGTDLPSYYERFGGFLIAASINRYVYITLHETFVDELIVKYSQLERVRTLEELQHPLIREAFKLTNVKINNLEIASMSDIPAGSGLGSSGSFTTALLQALHVYSRNIIPKRELAEQACQIEIEILKEPIGKQDQYIAAFGGLTAFTFNAEGSVGVQPLLIPAEAMANLEDNLVLFFTGYTRSASDILRDQDSRTRKSDAKMIEHLHFAKDVGLQSKLALEHGDLRKFAQLMHSYWEVKRQRPKGMTNDRIDEWYELALRNGALGGKLIGAGGGGFLMFYTEDKTRLRRAMQQAGAPEVRFRLDFEGTTTVIQS